MNAKAIADRSLGDILKQYRQRYGISQLDLAVKANVNTLLRGCCL